MVLASVEEDPSPIFIVTTLKPYNRKTVLDAALTAPQEQAHDDKSIQVSSASPHFGIHFLNDRCYLWGKVGDLRKWLDRGPVAHASLQTAISTSKHEITAGANVPALYARQLKEMLDGADDGDFPFPGMKSLKPLIDATSIIGGLNIGDNKAVFHVRFLFPSEAAAKGALQPGNDGLAIARLAMKQMAAAMAQDSPHAAELTAGWEKALQTATLKQQGNALIGTAQLPFDPKTLDVFAEATQKVRKAANRTRGANHLKMIMIAMHSHHDTHSALPAAAIYSKAGKPLLSWRVAILPFLEQEALYKQFKLDEPWDSEHNKKLLSKMPSVYAPQGTNAKDPTTTYYQVFTGKGSMFDGHKGCRFGEVLDGLSNTLCVVEAGDAVPWTKPQDIPFDPDRPLPKLTGPMPEGFNASRADASVVFVRNGFVEPTLRAFITKQGGEILNFDDLEVNGKNPQPAKPAQVPPPKKPAVQPAPAGADPLRLPPGRIPQAQPAAPAPGVKDVTRVVFPNDRAAALNTLASWLEARGIEHQKRQEVIVMRRGGVLLNIYPIVHEGELDRLRVTAFYYPKDEFKDSKEVEALAVKLNRSQNFLQVFVADDKTVAVGTNLTFFDELTAREFDAFLDAVASFVKTFIFTEEALKLLK